MKKKTKLPSNPSAVWSGGFAIESPGWISSVAASGGTVLAGGEQLYLLRPGATRWARREVPPAVGDAMAVGIDPRRRGRMVVVGPFGLAIFDGAELAVASSRERTLEFVELAWGPASVKGSDLYLLTDQETVLRVKAGAESFEELELPPVTAITSDEKGRIVYACVDEDDWTLDVHLFADPDLEVRHSVEAPAVMSDAYLAVQGGALAIGFPRDKVWLTRTVAKPHLACVEELSGGPVVFDGPGGHGALFGVAIEGNVTGLLRVAPDGTVARIGELGISGADASAAPGLVRQLAWDATRKTLWAAAGSAGVLSSTAPGAPAPGAGTAS